MKLTISIALLLRFFITGCLTCRTPFDIPILILTTVSTVAELIGGGIHALVDDNINVLIPIGNDHLYFAVP